jgi:hypothetical protein
MYSIKVDQVSLDAIKFSGHRYVWSDHLSVKSITEENGEMKFTFTESEAWEFHSALESEDFQLPLLSPNCLLFSEIHKFINSVV